MVVNFGKILSCLATGNNFSSFWNGKFEMDSRAFLPHTSWVCAWIEIMSQYGSFWFNVAKLLPLRNGKPAMCPLDSMALPCLWEVYGHCTGWFNTPVHSTTFLLSGRNLSSCACRDSSTGWGNNLSSSRWMKGNYASWKLVIQMHRSIFMHLRLLYDITLKQMFLYYWGT